MSSFNRGISTGNAKIDKKIKSLGKKNVSSTAGAIVTTNDKGETTMEKVKVKRYVAGKMPEFKPLKSPSKQTSSKTNNEQVINSNYYTIRDELKNQINEFTIDDQMNHEQIYTKNEIKVTYNRKSELTDDNTQPEVIRFNPEVLHHEEPNEDDAALRRRLIKEKLLAKQQQTTTKDKSQVDKETTKSPLDISEDEYEYYTSDEEETYSDDVGVTIPRLKPVFVRKEDRVTLHEPEVSTEISLTEAIDEKILAERRRESRRMVSSIRKEEMVDEQNVDTFDQVVITDDEDDEAEFEAWKLRELKRMKRDIEERQELENEKIELEKIRNMSEKERIKYFEQNPKFISNQATKGTYKYLQKYYHRGAFFLDRDDEIFKRNFDAPTLEDHFDKSVLPDYLQIKNFGKVGRTKYTHLTDQDTTDHMLNRDEASANIPAFQQKLHSKISAGSKQIFEKPSHKRKRQIDD